MYLIISWYHAFFVPFAGKMQDSAISRAQKLPARLLFSLLSTIRRRFRIHHTRLRYSSCTQIRPRSLQKNRYIKVALGLVSHHCLLPSDDGPASCARARGRARTCSTCVGQWTRTRTQTADRGPSQPHASHHLAAGLSARSRRFGAPAVGGGKLRQAYVRACMVYGEHLRLRSPARLLQKMAVQEAEERSIASAVSAAVSAVKGGAGDSSSWSPMLRKK